jgi:hypothetical protein
MSGFVVDYPASYHFAVASAVTSRIKELDSRLVLAFVDQVQIKSGLFAISQERPIAHLFAIVSGMTGNTNPS